MADPVFHLSGKRIDKLKVDELKAELERRGLKKSGTKGVLVERLQEFLEQEQMNKERLSYSGSTQQNTFGSQQYMYPNMISSQVTDQYDIPPLSNIPPPQNMPQHISQPPVRQSPLNQLPPAQATHYQQNLPPGYGRVEQTYLLAQQSSQRHPEFPLQKDAHSRILSEGQQQSLLNFGTSEKSDSDSSISEETGPSDNIPASMREFESSQLKSFETNLEASQVRQQVPHEKENAPNEKNEINVQREEKENSNEEDESSSSSSVDKDSPKEDETTQIVDAEQPEEDASNDDKLEDGEVQSPDTPEEKHSNRHIVEASVDVEPSEDDKAIVGDTSTPTTKRSRSPVIIKKRKLSVQRTPVGQTPNSSGDNSTGRKRRWGSSSSTKKKTTLSISTDSLKDLIPAVQVQSTAALEALMDFGQDEQEEEEVENIETSVEQKEEEKPQVVNNPEKEEVRRSRKERIVKVEESRTIKIHRKSSSSEMKSDLQQEITITEDDKMEVDQDAVAVNHNPRQPSQASSSPVDPDPMERSPSPALNPESVAIHVKNLVRPFTLNQLKELLGSNGTLVEGGFWIDRIKSHCYAIYSSVEEALNTRKALHGIKWPTTSPKILNVDFALDSEMFHDTEGELGKIQEDAHNEDSRTPAERGSHKQVTEEKVVEDEKSPANLLDNLFRKTTTLPYLYWLPLTDEQIAAKEKERELRRKKLQEERKKEEEERKERQKERELEREKERERERERQRERDREIERLREERIKQREKERERERERRQRSLERARDRARARDRRRSSSPRARGRRNRSGSSSSSSRSRSRSRDRGGAKRR